MRVPGIVTPNLPTNLMLFIALSLIETGFLPTFIDNNDNLGRVDAT